MDGIWDGLAWMLQSFNPSKMHQSGFSTKLGTLDASLCQHCHLPYLHSTPLLPQHLLHAGAKHVLLQVCPGRLWATRMFGSAQPPWRLQSQDGGEAVVTDVT